MQPDKMIGVSSGNSLDLGIFARTFWGPISIQRLAIAPKAKRLFRRAIVFFKDQIASKKLLIKIKNILKTRKERSESMGFI